METLSSFIELANGLLSPVLVTGLLGAGLFLTLRLGFIQIRRLGHGFAVTSGKYDDPNEPGDVSHFQALTTALSATVGIGNIAGVALAIHWGGPGALFWMWITALLGMATKYSEVTLAQHYRETIEDGKAWEGSVAGGPMYYIEKGIKERYGWNWKPVAVFFAFMLMMTSFMTGNAIQANTIATEMASNFGLAKWITGLCTATIVGVVIIGGIRRIGAVTGVLAPLMAALYVTGGLLILLLNAGDVPGTLATIITEAFNPSAGVAGTGIGLFLTTMTYGVQRGLFSNEAGQGSAPIAHSAAKTDEPVSEGVVALLEPFIDTIIICTITGLVIVSTGVFDDKVPTTISLGDNNVSYVQVDDRGNITSTSSPRELAVQNGMPVVTSGTDPRLAYFDVPVDTLFIDAAQTQPFTGTIFPGRAQAVGSDGTTYAVLYGNAVRNSAPLTSLGFQRGLEPLGLSELGRWIVLLCVFLFAISTAISWSYYGDRCANYLWGKKAILPYKMVFLVMHFLGAVVAVTTIWDLGDVALSLVTLPNVITLVLLSGLLKRVTDSYFQRKPWLENYEVHRRIVEEKKQKAAARKQHERI
ncbi:amino acid carrier protein [Rhodocaloribacter litoris]|uniref:alanine/glycine:cation symporter family protein n=1 Tax=Rhodocaloribacter litoris TaxID=2558931 RepID=UPI0014247E8E|nr:amino acid carrier protein [Rhodocaloribacter litoris]QXD15209.1 amino acid carrier protein [Rhodocaloribacter litoris]GIV60428.1 MAG: amino acid transporter [Rhodothermaceae bacterium]